MELYAQIETPTEGPQKVWVDHGFGKDPGLPADVNPIATIVLPAAGENAKPATLTVPLDQRCCGSIFHGPVTIPAEAALGNAKVTLSFPGWTNSPLAPVATHVRVVAKEPDLPAE